MPTFPHQDVIFLDETGPMSSPMKAKGVARADEVIDSEAVCCDAK